MKTRSKILAVVLAVTITFAFFSLGHLLEHGPPEMNLNAQEMYHSMIIKKDTKQVKNFPHKKHQGEMLKGNAEYSYFKYKDDWTCVACHHTSAIGEQPTACLKCKDANKMFAKVGGYGRFDQIYHLVCRDGCHETMNKAGKKSGPGRTTGGRCKGCHNRT